MQALRYDQSLLLQDEDESICAMIVCCDFITPVQAQVNVGADEGKIITSTPLRGRL